ncbi:MAG: hypothetical protein ACI9JN_000146 [Bacteroidia bacterium]|jgi:hypothetical protein
MDKLHSSQYRLRKIVGILGIALPILLLLNHDYLLSSMSHYYYTSSSIFFIGILVSFGLILFTYQGYPLDETKREFLSDETTTTLAAIFIFIAVLIPTEWDGAMGDIHFEDNANYLFGHDNGIKGAVHLISAGLFLSLLGYMCFAKFTLSQNDPPSRKLFYKISGVVIWSSLGLLLILFVIDSALLDGNLNCYFPGYTFWLESIAVWSFGISWLIKGKFDRDVNGLFKKESGIE